MHLFISYGLYIISDLIETSVALVTLLWFVYQQRSNKNQCMHWLNCYDLYISSDLIKPVYALVELFWLVYQQRSYKLVNVLV